MLYFFLLLMHPFAPTCVLWINHPPVVQDYYAPVCPLAVMDSWDWYTLRLVDAAGSTLCEWPASDSLTILPCKPSPSNNYHIEVWSKRLVAAGCNLWLVRSYFTVDELASQCPELLDDYRSGKLIIYGPYEIHPPVPVASACTLPQVNNSAPLATAKDYQFLAGRLAWWGIAISPLDWQNRFDEQIRGASDNAGVPAQLLKAMLADESQFWPLWTGDAGEVGWLQLTWDGADTALRHDPDLFARYCQRAIWPFYCTGYDLLNSSQRDAVRTELVRDLAVTGNPVKAAAAAADDLWIYAHILRAYACQARDLFPERDVWQTAAVLYNAGSACIQGGVICPQGQKYLDEVNK